MRKIKKAVKQKCPGGTIFQAHARSVLEDIADRPASCDEHQLRLY